MSDIISYTGKVDIHITTKDGKYLRYVDHNNGTDRLFLALCLALYGEPISEYRPRYLVLAEKVGAVYNSVVSEASGVTPSLKYSEQSPSVSFIGVL